MLSRTALSFYLVILLVDISAFGAVTTTKAVTKPAQVTVYPSGARVVREGTVELEEGPHAVLFTDLPASLLEQSLRLTVEGPKGTRYFGVGLKKEFTDKVVDARSRKTKERIQKLQDQRTDLADKVASRNTEINILKSYGTYGTNHNRKNDLHNINIDKFTHSAATISKRIGELTAENRKQERLMRDIDLKINALSSQLSQGSAAAREKRTAQADLELKESGKVRFKLSYQVPGASWAPIYDLNLDSKAEKPVLEFGFNGNIRQTTGEDWNGVTLTLSTSRPNEATQVPDPTNWWLGAYEVQTQMYRRSQRMEAPSSAPAAEMAEDRATAKKVMEGKSADLEPAQLELTKTVQAAFAAHYSITVPKDIPSDGSDHRVGVLQSQYPVDLSIVVVPRHSLAAFIEAKVDYGGEQILLPGPAQLFRDGDFTGTAQLAAAAPGESFTLGFGQDDLVRTERKKGDVQSSKGERRYQWLTTVANYHPGKRVVEVREQLPRTQQREIAVEIDDVEPKPLQENPEKPGLVVWRLELDPKQKVPINFNYHVSYPSNFNVSNLD